MAGKGDTPRPVDKERYDRNYTRIFGRKKKCDQPTTKGSPKKQPG